MNIDPKFIVDVYSGAGVLYLHQVKLGLGIILVPPKFTKETRTTKAGMTSLICYRSIFTSVHLHNTITTSLSLSG